MSTIDQPSLARLDADGYNVLEAITDANLGRPTTLSRPNAFICLDGSTYWVKNASQQGLVAELIGGRLAAKVGAGPLARIIRVTLDVLLADGSLNHLEGVVVGIHDVPSTINSKDLAPFVGSGQFQPGLIDPVSRGGAIVFQSWLGSAGDPQVLIGLTTGSIACIDHGDCFGSTDTLSDPVPIVTPIPGVGADVGKRQGHMLPTIERIEAISDRELLEAVSRIPSGTAWRSPVDRRVQIAQWLAHRRDRLREVMITWIQT